LKVLKDGTISENHATAVIGFETKSEP
jgi:hypothetical protein